MRIFFLSQLPMAASAAALLFFCATLLGARLPADIYLAAAFGTWAVYLWDAERGAENEDRVSHPERSALFRRWGRGARVTASAAALECALLALPELHRWTTLSMLALLLAIAVGYVFHLLPGKEGRYRLKDVPWLKSIWVASAWTLGGVALPLLFVRFHTGTRWVKPLPLAVLVWLLLLMDTLLLDFRDREADRHHGVRTFAQNERLFRRALAAGCALCFAIAAIQPAPLSLLATTAAFSAAAWVVLHTPTGEIQHALLVGAWRFVGAACVLGLR